MFCYKIKIKCYRYVIRRLLYMDMMLLPRLKEELVLAISLVSQLKERFKLDHLAAILMGESSAMIKSYHHDRLRLFGAGKDHSFRFWCSVIQQAVLAHFLFKDVESYGTIGITPSGREFLEHPYSIQLTTDREYADGEDDEEEENIRGGGGGDEKLLSMLKDLRKDLSHKYRLQSWIIFSDASLEDTSIMSPVTLEELKKCQGVGDGKARKYGEPFLKLISNYVEENDIIRPDDFVMKTRVPSNSKIQIIQSVDRKIPLAEIARSLGIEYDELIGELESIVYSGTRLNLNYAISQIMDEDDISDIFDYFRNAETDHMKEAMEEFGGFYEENEVRLARLKFICEVAN